MHAATDADERVVRTQVCRFGDLDSKIPGTRLLVHLVIISRVPDTRGILKCFEGDELPFLIIKSTEGEFGGFYRSRIQDLESEINGVAGLSQALPVGTIESGDEQIIPLARGGDGKFDASGRFARINTIRSIDLEPVSSDRVWGTNDDLRVAKEEVDVEAER